MKMRQDHDIIDHRGTLYTENEIELSRLMWHDTEYEQDQIGKQRD